MRSSVLIILLLMIVAVALALSGCSYTDASGGTGADGSTRWQVISYNLLWGREVTLPSGVVLKSGPDFEDLTAFAKRDDGSSAQ